MEEFNSNDPVEYPVTDELDLHTFHPSDVHSVVDEYIRVCHENGFTKVRIIHGKGKSVQKYTVHKVLKKNPLVDHFHDAPPYIGGWGATIVILK